jgi:hypothetical protein
MLTWLWCAAEGEVLSSCETFRMDSLWQADAMRGFGKGHTYGVASVFTEPALRGQGHARAMMQALGERLLTEDPLVHASTLFSDVGTALYESAGYVALPAWDWVFSPLTPPGPVSSEGLRLFREDELETCWEMFRRPEEAFLVWPTAVQLDWHLERARSYATFLTRPLPRHTGAAHPGGTIVWAADEQKLELAVLLFQARTLESAAALLEAARRAAGEAGLTLVRFWETNTTPKLSSLGGERRARKGSLPMVRPLTAGLDAASWSLVFRGLSI